MVMTETTFAEFVEFINVHPIWRQKLAQALFPDIDVAKAFQDLADVQRRTLELIQELTGRVSHIETDVSVLKTDVSVLKTDVSVLKADVSVLKRDMTQVKRDLTHLKGFNYESRIIQRADAILGRFMRRGHDARNEIGLLLEEAEEQGLITEQEHDHVLALDLLWGGKQKGSKADVVLAIEISWRVEATDLERVVARANILRKMGLVALPLVAGLVWEEDVLALAQGQKVVMVQDMVVDALSWEGAF